MFEELGLLDYDREIILDNWLSFVHVVLKAKGTPRSLSNILATETEPWRVDDALQYLGLIQPSTFGFVSPMPPLPNVPMKPLMIFGHLLSHKLRYLPGERDMAVLSNEVIVKDKSTSQLEMHKSSLITYGFPSGDHSASQRIVGTSAAILALAIADGKIPLRGLQGLWHPSMYNEVCSRGLKRLVWV